jgi:F-type H+-transporting ATPase subunit epsilon
VAKRTALHCCVITPERQVLDMDVDAVVLPAHDGQIGILRNRAPLVCELGVGVMRFSGANDAHELFVDGGFAQVLDNEVTVLTPRAAAPAEINRAAASTALAEAEKMRITDDASRIARDRALARAKTQLKLAP